MTKHIFILTISLLTLNMPNVFTQNIRGLILSASDSTALPYAHISILGKPVGTCSNYNGEFVFNFDSAVHQSDTLAISFMGFKTYTCSVQSLDTSFHNIFLEEQEYQLGEVVILEPGELERIVKRSIRKRNKNYYQRPYQAEGFYRNLSVTQDSTIAYLEEAAFVENRAGLFTDTDNDQVFIKEIRRSDQLYEISFKKKIFDKFHPSNSLYLAKGWGDMVRLKLVPGFIDKHEITLDRVIRTDSSKIYKVNYEYLNPLGRGESAYFGGIIYINDADWAVIRMEQGFILRKMNKTYKSKTLNQAYQGRKFLYHITEYKKIHKERYGIVSAMSIGSVWDEDEESKIYKLEWITYNNAIFRKNDYMPTQEMVEIGRHILMGKVQMEYNPDFWQTYNYPPLEQYKNGITYLEKEKPLKQQFMENGAK